MISIGQEILGLCDEVVGNIWDLFDYTQSTQCSLEYG